MSETTPEEQVTPSPGRPRLLADPQKRQHVCSLVSIGVGLEAAAQHVGCSTFTIRREALRDPEFARQLRESHTAAELLPLQAIRQAAKTHWRAAAWMLERRYPEQFGQRRPDAVSPAHLKSLFDELAALFTEECSDPEARMRLLSRLLEMQEVAPAEFKDNQNAA